MKLTIIDMSMRTFDITKFVNDCIKKMKSRIIMDTIILTVVDKNIIHSGYQYTKNKWTIAKEEEGNYYLCYLISEKKAKERVLNNVSIVPNKNTPKTPKYIQTKLF